MISAETALSYGLVNKIAPQNELLDSCINIANKIVRNSPIGISAAIESVNAGFKDGVNGYDIEISSFGNCFGTDDFVEGTTAFLEKRKPKF